MSESSHIQIIDGIVHALFAYDIGQSVNLDKIESNLKLHKERLQIAPKRRAPKYISINPHPIKIFEKIEPIQIGAFQTQSQVEVLIYDFAAVSLTYKIPISGNFDQLIQLSELLYDHEELSKHAFQNIESLCKLLKGSINKPNLSKFVESYNIFQIKNFDPPQPPGELEKYHAREIARILRSERETLSGQEISDALYTHISYTEQDLAYIDWGTSLVFDQDADDVLAVLEYANVALLEFRMLDQQLDDALEKSQELMSKKNGLNAFIPGKVAFDMNKIGQMQLESALLFEDVHNSLKLIGDQYLSRLYKLASERQKLSNWSNSILRKLETLESIYQKYSARKANLRMELLEWIIIVLIAISILLPFFPQYSGGH